MPLGHQHNRPEQSGCPGRGHRRSGAVRRLAVPTAVSVLLTGCSVFGDDPQPLKTVTIGLDSPLSGDLADAGLSIRNSVELAVAKANEKHLVPGVRFELDPKDDAGDPARAKANAAALAANPVVLGVVGPYSSSVALEMSPVLAEAGLAQVSPSNTLPGLTWGPDYRGKGKSRLYETYFRTVTTDAIQGPYLADLLRRSMQVANAAVISDTKAYGKSLADEFAGEFEYTGGTVLLRRTVEPGATDFTALVEQIRSSKDQLVYYGGESPEAGRIAAQLAAAGVRIPVAGGDAMHSEEYLHLAGATASEGTLATSAGIAIDNLASAYAYVDAYTAAGYTVPHGPFGPYAYDSAWAWMLAVGSVVTRNDGVLPDQDLQKAVTSALQKVTFLGVTGEVSFDKVGDNYNQSISLYKVENGKWTTLVSSGRWAGH